MFYNLLLGRNIKFTYRRERGECCDDKEILKDGLHGFDCRVEEKNSEVIVIFFASKNLY